MKVRGLVVVLACLLTAGCAGDPVDLEGVEEIGTTKSGAVVYAARLGSDRVDVRVLVDGTLWCNASGPSSEPAIGLCSGFFPEGSIYVATVGKGDEVPQVCDQQTGAAVGVDRVTTPGTWGFDFVVGVMSEQALFLAPCSALRAARWSRRAL